MYMYVNIHRYIYIYIYICIYHILHICITHHNDSKDLPGQQRGGGLAALGARQISNDGRPRSNPICRPWLLLLLLLLLLLRILCLLF